MMRLTKLARGWYGIIFAVVVFTACRADGPTQPEIEDLPQLLSELDITGTLFAPQYPLWTNGSLKTRTVRRPAGGTINTANRNAWLFPEGTIFVKEFAYAVPGGGTPLKVETRIIRVRNGQVETAAYLWNAQQTDATLLPGTSRVPVSITDISGNTFDHVVPSSADCRACHGSSPSFILGFNELQLGASLGGGANTQLAALAASGWFSATLPANPEEIAGDAETRAVLGYFEGNCVHCHNPNGPFDIQHQTFFSNVVGRSGAAGGLLIDPQNPNGSLIYLRDASGSMPPLGVQLRDTIAHNRVRDWIISHDFGAP